MTALFPHPDTPLATVQSIDTMVWQEGGAWNFRFLIEGRADLVIPDSIETGRAHELWRTTCVEAFVGLPGGAYLEFNFSPSGQWAAYRFDSLREGMRDEPAEVDMFLDAGEDWLGIEAAVRCKALEPGLTLGLSAVMEERGGVKSYWALAHPAKGIKAPPDFHDPTCFIARLPE